MKKIESSILPLQRKIRTMIRKKEDRERVGNRYFSANSATKNEFAEQLLTEAVSAN